MNFRGTFEHTLDAKHRLTVPAKYRAALSPGVVIAIRPETEPGAPRCVQLWVPDDYDAYVAGSLAGLNPLSARYETLSRVLSSNSWETELDTANRVMIPQLALNHAGLSKDVTVTGSGTHLEVWDRAVWPAYNAALMTQFTDLVASVDHTA